MVKGAIWVFLENLKRTCPISFVWTSPAAEGPSLDKVSPTSIFFFLKLLGFSGQVLDSIRGIIPALVPHWSTHVFFKLSGHSGTPIFHYFYTLQDFCKDL